jgi:hypothetical protein
MNNKTHELSPSRQRLEDSASYAANRRSLPEDDYFKEIDCCIIKKLHAEHERLEEEMQKPCIPI